MKLNEGTLFTTNEKVAELNRVAGFNPLDYVRNTAGGAVLDLPYQKMWFRLKNPNGKIRLLKHKISEKIAIIEARVYLDRRDNDPVSSFTAQRENKAGSRYIEEAQYAAIAQALSDAGFGLQFVSSNPNPEGVKAPEKVVSPPQANNVAKTVAEKPAEKSETKPIVQQEEAPKKVEDVPNVVEEEPKASTEAPQTDLLQFVEDETPKTVQPEAKAEDPLLAFANVLDGKKEAVGASQNDTVAQTPVESSVSNGTVANETPSTPPYTKDMSVEEICSMMSVDDAENYVVNIGSVKGMTVKEIYDSPRRAVLRMYLDPTKYKGDDNIFRAAATLVLASHGESVAA